MPTWLEDGTVSGYDPSILKNRRRLFHLASPGSVDVEGGTRLHWDLSDSYPDRDSYNTRLRTEVKFRFTSEEFDTYINRHMGAATVVAKASEFEGVPTPKQIINAGWGPIVAAGSGSTWFLPTGGAPVGDGDITVASSTQNYLLEPNTKYWVLVYPAAILEPEEKWSRTNHLAWGDIDVLGRAISFWTNRTPAAPTITSPLTGSVFASGTTFNLTYDPNDPDELTPNDPERSNADLAGVEIQYARVPTVDAPDPSWTWMDYKDAEPGSYPNYAITAVGHTVSANRIGLVRNLGSPVACGVDPSDAPGSHLLLPEGDWQIRVRTADFGHAYPNIINPLGAYPAISIQSGLWPEDNKSPWSEPVRVSVPSQVPPPIPINPRDSVAVQEGSTVRLSWQYRNTFDPPKSQKDRWVQIRKVGDDEWKTVFAGVSGNNYVDLPSSITAPAPIPDVEYASDPGAEDGTTGNWFSTNADEPTPFTPPSSAGVSVVNVNDPALSHSGNRHLRIDNTNTAPDVTSWPYAVFNVSVAGIPHNEMRPSTWFRPPDNAVNGLNPSVSEMNAGIAFFDAAGEVIPPVVGDEYPLLEIVIPPSGWEWVHLEYPELEIPPGSDYMVLYISTVGTTDESEIQPLTGHRIDDTSVIGFYSFNTDSFTMEATTQYEWRVRVRDTDGIKSNWSQPARFWVVPASASGEVRPVPDDTVDGATLGCGTHRAFIYRRGGLERVGELRGISYLDWGRVRDDISTSKIVVEDWDIDCGNLLSKLQTWAYEIVVFRDNGYDTDRVWEGPITLLTYEHDRVTIHARDVMVYPYRRIIKQAMNDSGTGAPVTSRAAQILQNVLAPDDPNVLAYLQVLSGENDSMQYRSTPAFSRTAYEEIDDMAANSGLDYTAVGRAILLWGTRNRIGTLPEFRDSDLGAFPIVSEYGMSMSNSYAVSDGNGVYGDADRLNDSGNDPIYGLVEMLSSTWASDSTEDTGIFTQEGLETVRQSFREFAERSITDRYPPPVVVRVPDNTTINPDAVISIQQLVPGVVIPLRSTGTLRTVVGDQKLDSIRVVEESGKETISITLSPFNYDDAGTATEGGDG